MKLPAPVETIRWGTQEVLRFEHSQDALAWAQRELERWPAATIQNPYLSKYWNQQRNGIGRVLEAAKAIDAALAAGEAEPQLVSKNSALQGALTELANGQVLTSDHPAYPAIRAALAVDHSSAALILAAWRAGGDDFLGVDKVPNQGSLARLVSLNPSDDAMRHRIEQHSSELLSIRNESSAELDDLRKRLSEVNERISAFDTEQQQFVSLRHSEWDEIKTRTDAEWQGLKKTYDEELALEAPTKYWEARSVESYKNARAFGIASGVAALCVLVIFLAWGVGYIETHEKAGLFGAIAPLLVPAFIGVWLLKVLTRLMSDNLQLARDARERQTMVKTFLALIHEQTRGRALVTDEDRILILHALFRPSAVASIDDAPPVHWFDLLMKRQADAVARRHG